MLRRSIGFIILALAISLPMSAAALPSSAPDAGLKKEITELNQLTGDAAIAARYKDLASRPKQSKKLFAFAQELLKKDKTALNYNAALVLAETAKKLGRVKSAERFYRVCMAAAAKLESTRKIVQSYGGLIDLLYEDGQFGRSAKVCRELLELDTGSGKPRVVLIPVETRFGTLTFYEDDNYDSVRRIKPGVHKLLIQAVTKDGKYDRALKLVDNLVRTSKHWRERQLRAWVLREAGRFKEAAQAYEDVIDRVGRDKELEGKERQLYEDRYRYILSNVYVDMKNIDMAAKQLLELIKRNPDEPSYHNDLGYVWADHGMHLKKAEEHIRKALELDRARRKKITNISPEEDRDNGAYLDSLGWVLFKQKRYKEAKAYLLKAVADKRTQHIEIFDHLGDAHFALGEREAAIKAWKRGVEVAGSGRREQRIKSSVEKKIEKYSK